MLTTMTILSLKSLWLSSLWGEEFNFPTDELPVKLDDAGHSLDSPSGQVCLNINAIKLPVNGTRAATGYAGAGRRRVTLDPQGSTNVHLKPGPLQTIFDLLPDEACVIFLRLLSTVINVPWRGHSLIHGRMYVSAWHICFHSNVFSKQMKASVSTGILVQKQKLEDKCES